MISLNMSRMCLVILWVTGMVCCNKIKREDASRASKHFARVLKEARCSQPFPRVIKMSDVMPNSTRKTYLPRCTLIHYCGDDTGCCSQDNQRCVAAKKEAITLYFWVMEITDRGSRKGVEKVVLLNHTECHCQVFNNSLNMNPEEDEQRLRVKDG